MLNVTHVDKINIVSLYAVLEVSFLLIHMLELFLAIGQ